MTLRIVFMGTPEFAVPTLEALLQSSHHLVAVVSQPDREVGRGRRLTQPPVKKVALAHGIPVLQPASLRDPAVHAEIAGATTDLINTGNKLDSFLPKYIFKT